MGTETLRQLWERELQDLYATEQQTITALPEMIKGAASTRLRDTLQNHLQRTEIQLERLDLIMKKSGIQTDGHASSGVDSIVRRGSQVVQEGAASEARDAAIIAAAQHVEHYEMAGYGCARTWARQLGDESSADLLQQTLDEEGEADQELTAVAQSGINQAATAGIELDTAVRPRLRYVDVGDLPTATAYRDARVRNRAGEDLGRMDGFLVDPSGRPYYMVVDSGGLFIGRRYIAPIGRADFRREDRVFVVDLDKDLLKRYPEFHRDAFLSMRDEEARRYEWRVLEAIDPDAARASTQRVDYDRLPHYRQPDWFDRTLLATPAAERVTRTETRQPPLVSETRARRIDPGGMPASHPMFAQERRMQLHGRRAGDVH